jgi:hypothetical protein
MLPAYLVLWVAGTGCFGDVYLFENEVDACIFTMALEMAGIDMSDYVLVLDITSGATILLPESLLTVNGTISPNVSVDSRLDVYDVDGAMTQRVELPLSANMQLSGGTDFPQTMLAPGYRMALYLKSQQQLREFYGNFNLSATSFRVTPPTLRFPTPANRGGFTTAFDAEFGIPYVIPEGDLVFEGSVTAPEGSRARVPKKVIVEIAHLDENGRVLSKHKQKIKIKKRNGKFKTSRKSFKGYDMAPGESVRLRLKPKRGDLDGLNWMLEPALNF